MTLVLTFALITAESLSSRPTVDLPVAGTLEEETPTRTRLIQALDHGLTVIAGDDILRGAVGMVLRPRLSVTTDGAWPALSLQMARPQLRVSGWQNRIRLFVQPELADNVRLLDAEASVRLRPWFGLRAGRFVTAFSRTFYTPVPHLKFPDFATANVRFRVDRDVGGSLFGEAGSFDWEASVVSGRSTVPDPADKSHFLTLARLNTQIVGKVPYDENICTFIRCDLGLSLGVNGSYHRYELHTGGIEQRVTAGVDVAFMIEHFQLQGELYYRGTYTPFAEPRTYQWGGQWGGYVHAAYAVIPDWFELAARADVLQSAYGIDGLASVYILRDHAKLWLQYTARNETSWSQRVLLQMQFWL